jgi:hypothetical protein
MTDLLNAAEKFFGIIIIICLFGAVFLFDTSGSDDGGTFEYLTEMTEAESGTGNHSDYTDLGLAVFPIGLFVMFLLLIGYVIFK